MSFFGVDVLVLSSLFPDFLFLAFPFILLPSDCEDWIAFTSMETVGLEGLVAEAFFCLEGLATDEG